MNEPTIRQVDARDYPAIDAFLAKGVPHLPNKNWQHLIDVAKLEPILKNQSPLDVLIIDETYMVVVHPVVPWYSSSLVLEELLTERLYPNGEGTFKSLTQAMEIIAKDVNAVGIITGTALANNDKALGRMYTREGYVQGMIGFYKGMK